MCTSQKISKVKYLCLVAGACNATSWRPTLLDVLALSVRPDCQQPSQGVPLEGSDYLSEDREMQKEP